MSQPILIVEDDPMQSQMLATLLHRKMGFEACMAENGHEMLQVLDADIHQNIKLIILDLDMPIMGGMESLEILQQRYPSLPVIMLTGSTHIDDVVNAMKLGAIDFLTKPYESDRMMISVKNALKMSTLSKELSRLKSEQEGCVTFKNLIGHDTGLLHVVNTAQKAAASNIPVLIGGETGTGKEVLSEAIHGESARVGKPFVAVNCGAIPAQLVESILFGHEKGSFTGAHEKAIGKFREAEGGTIFLDEVGELPLDTQVKLLRVLQQKEVEPVGASKPVPINVRVISATNKNLEEEIKAGNFREDLFFRLNVLQLELPPLRERREDILTLANHFIERFCVNEGGIPKGLSSTMERELINHEWPGNVRQLENTLNRAMVVSDGNTLNVEDFSTLLENNDPPASHPITNIEQNIYSMHLLHNNGEFKTAEEIEQETMTIALQHFQNNITQASKALGIAKSTFYKKMKLYHL